MKFHFLLGLVIASPVNIIPDALRLFGRYAGAAKCKSIYEKQAWDCGDICNDERVKNTKLVYAKIDQEIDGAVQVTRNDDMKLIVISFRGTDSKKNWIQNLMFFKSSPDWQEICLDTEDCDAFKSDNDTQVWNDKKLANSNLVQLPTNEANILPTNIYVHSGFEGQYLRLRDINLWIKKEADENPDYQIICTGHSLGGAMAHLSAADLNDLYGFGPRISIYTYGQPRVGDQAWAEYLASLPFGDRIYRYAIRGDPVVQLPPRILGYRHSRYQWMVNKDGSLTSCNYDKGKFESEECIWGALENNVDIHKQYDFGGKCA